MTEQADRQLTCLAQRVCGECGGKGYKSGYSYGDNDAEYRNPAQCSACNGTGLRFPQLTRECGCKCHWTKSERPCKPCSSTGRVLIEQDVMEALSIYALERSLFPVVIVLEDHTKAWMCEGVIDYNLANVWIVALHQLTGARECTCLCSCAEELYPCDNPPGCIKECGHFLAEESDGCICE